MNSETGTTEKKGDTMQLTSEQLENAARIAYEVWYDGYHSWDECPERHKEDMRKAIAAAFAAIEPPQVEVPVVLMPNGERVALEDPRVLGDVTYEERAIHRYQPGFIPSAIDTFLASRRARLLQPKRDCSDMTNELLLYCFRAADGKNDRDFLRALRVELESRLGPVAKLKAEGPVSGETGGNAQ